MSDGKEGPAYDGTASGSLTFSPDSGRLAYAARRGKQWFVNLDNLPGPALEGFMGLRFSPNSRRFMYGGNMDGKRCLFIDGRMGPEYHPFNHRAPLPFDFSPDSLHLAYVVSVGASQAVVLDQQQGPEFDEVVPGSLRFRENKGVEYFAIKGMALHRVTQEL